MSAETRKSWLVAYDIGDDKRLRRVQRYLSKQGQALQFSVFLLKVPDQVLDDVKRALAKLIDDEGDDVRFYQLTRAVRIETWGTSYLLDGIALLAQNQDKI